MKKILVKKIAAIVLVVSLSGSTAQAAWGLDFVKNFSFSSISSPIASLVNQAQKHPWGTAAIITGLVGGVYLSGAYSWLKKSWAGWFAKSEPVKPELKVSFENNTLIIENANQIDKNLPTQVTHKVSALNLEQFAKSLDFPNTIAHSQLNNDALSGCLQYQEIRQKIQNCEPIKRAKERFWVNVRNDIDEEGDDLVRGLMGEHISQPQQQPQSVVPNNSNNISVIQPIVEQIIQNSTEQGKATVSKQPQNQLLEKLPENEKNGTPQPHPQPEKAVPNNKSIVSPADKQDLQPLEQKPTYYVSFSKPKNENTKNNKDASWFLIILDDQNRGVVSTLMTIEQIYNLKRALTEPESRKISCISSGELRKKLETLDEKKQKAILEAIEKSEDFKSLANQIDEVEKQVKKEKTQVQYKKIVIFTKDPETRQPLTTPMLRIFKVDEQGRDACNDYPLSYKDMIALHNRVNSKSVQPLENEKLVTLLNDQNLVQAFQQSEDLQDYATKVAPDKVQPEKVVKQEPKEEKVTLVKEAHLSHCKNILLNSGFDREKEIPTILQHYTKGCEALATGLTKTELYKDAQKKLLAKSPLNKNEKKELKKLLKTYAETFFVHVPTVFYLSTAAKRPPSEGDAKKKLEALKTASKTCPQELTFMIDERPEFQEIITTYLDLKALLNKTGERISSHDIEGTKIRAYGINLPKNTKFLGKFQHWLLSFVPRPDGSTNIFFKPEAAGTSKEGILKHALDYLKSRGDKLSAWMIGNDDQYDSKTEYSKERRVLTMQKEFGLLLGYTVEPSLYDYLAKAWNKSSEYVKTYMVACTNYVKSMFTTSEQPKKEEKGTLPDTTSVRAQRRELLKHIAKTLKDNKIEVRISSGANNSKKLDDFARYLTNEAEIKASAAAGTFGIFEHITRVRACVTAYTAWAKQHSEHAEIKRYAADAKAFAKECTKLFAGNFILNPIYADADRRQQGRELFIRNDDWELTCATVLGSLEFQLLDLQDNYHALAATSALQQIENPDAGFAPKRGCYTYPAFMKQLKTVVDLINNELVSINKSCICEPVREELVRVQDLYKALVIIENSMQKEEREEYMTGFCLKENLFKRRVQDNVILLAENIKRNELKSVLSPVLQTRCETAFKKEGQQNVQSMSAGVRKIYEDIGELRHIAPYDSMTTAQNYVKNAASHMNEEQIKQAWDPIRKAIQETMAKEPHAFVHHIDKHQDEADNTHKFACLQLLTGYRLALDAYKKRGLTSYAAEAGQLLLDKLTLGLENSAKQKAVLSGDFQKTHLATAAKNIALHTMPLWPEYIQWDQYSWTKPYKVNGKNSEKDWENKLANNPSEAAKLALVLVNNPQQAPTKELEITSLKGDLEKLKQRQQLMQKQ